MVSDEQSNLSHRPFADLARTLDRELKRQIKRAKPSEPVEPAGAAKPEPKPKPKPAGPAGQYDTESPVDEEQLFQQEMGDVKPLTGKDGYVPQARVSPPIPPSTSDEAEVMAQLADLVAGRGTFDFSVTDEHIEGIAVGLDKGLLKKLRQGQFACQAHLDLHGKTRKEARQLVEQFFVESRRRGLRSVLVVHGRGLNSKDQIPVLKDSLKVWLARGRIARSVLCFCSARPVDGGAGAVYVLLRK